MPKPGRTVTFRPSAANLEAVAGGRQDAVADQFGKEKTEQMKFLHVDMLSQKDRGIYRAMTPNTPMLVDDIVRVGGFTISEVFSAMTMLEIAGAVEAGAGGYYVRTSDDDGLLDLPSEAAEESAVL